MGKGIRAVLAVMCILAAAFAVAGCSSSKTWFEDDRFVITGLSVVEEASGLYSAQGEVKAKSGVETKLLMATVVLRDKDGNQLAETVGMASDVPEGGKATFTVALFDGSNFFDKEKADSVASYEITDLFTAEDLESATAQKRKEATEAQKALRNKLS